MRGILRSLKLISYFCQPALAYQGAWIQDPATDQLYRHWPVSKQTAQQLLDYFEQPQLRSLLSVHFYINDQLYVRELTPETQIYSQRSGIEPIAVGDLRQVLIDEPTKVLALSDDTAVIDQLLGSLRQQYTPAELYLTKSGEQREKVRSNKKSPAVSHTFLL